MTAYPLLPHLKRCELRTPWDARRLSGYRHLLQAISRRFKGPATTGKRERRAGRYRQGGRGRGDIGELFDDLDYFLLLRGYPQKYMPGWHRVFLGSCTIGLGKSLGIQEE
jgi:hypothetical protein